MATLEIAGRRIGPGQPSFLIAEAGVNHNGDVALARRLIDVAAEAGADAVKFQIFLAARLVAPDAPQAEYQKRNTGVVESQQAMLQRLELSEEAHRELMRHCHTRGILFLSSPFDEESADFLAALGVVAFKIPSGEITNTPFLAHVARKGRPMIVSTGMSTLDEVRAAVETIRQSGNPPLALLHCVSNYPAAPEDINLRAMATLREAFAVPVGYSDHTDGIDIALAAVALGACIVEKHFTLDRNLPGPDHKASLEPAELAAMVQGIRRVELALGDGIKRPAEGERNTASVARKSLVAACDLPVGAILRREHVAVRRPGTGLSPARIESLIGRRILKPVPVGTILMEDMLE
jgi:N-acetylneuraminate synthase/N,N'-diacetyllegionaminate synthase